MNAAWTPAVRPSEGGYTPAHARLDGSGHPVPLPTEPWDDQLAALDDPWPPQVEPTADPLDLPPPLPPTLVASRLAAPGSRLRPRDDDTAPLALVPFQRAEEPVAYPLETPPRGLRTFDLGTVPASVTPPRTWRKAAWFAVGTSAAVVCGLAVAAVRLVGDPSPVNTIDALPAYPTKPLELENLPAQQTSGTPVSSSRRPSSGSSSSDTPTRSNTTHRTDVAPPAPGSTEELTPSAPGSSGGGDPSSAPTTTTEQPPPTRTTVGPATPTDPQEMGDRTEQYFALVTDNPQAAHELCTGGMAREGPEGIESRYSGVDRVEVQEIIIDRNEAITTSTVKVVHQDGTATIEKRQLTFTWGGDPKISDESTTG